MIARPVDLFDFHGMPLTVYQAYGDNFVALQPVAEMFSLSWESAVAEATSDDGKALYGSRYFHVLPADRYIPDAQAEADADQLPQLLCIRLQSMPFFLFRADSGAVRAAGHIEAADRLLALQKEYGSYLHDYMGGNV